VADAQLAMGDAAGAIATLLPPGERRTLSPRAKLLQIEALRRGGQSAQAMERLAEFRGESGLSPEALAALETQLAAGVLADAPDADVLAQRWQSSPARLREHPSVLAAYARRAAALGLDAVAADVLADALDRQWDPDLVRLYGELPTDGEGRRVRAEAWLPEHPDDAALLLTLARLNGAEQRWARAEEQLHRALALGAGPEAWETLGTLHTAQGDAVRAELAYANALRAARGEPVRPIGRTLREQIASEAVAEQRNEHGMP
jgi:HemY protein